MEKKDESIYFLYPRNFTIDVAKTVFSSFLTSKGNPTLMYGEVQTFTEEDVANFGIENLCKSMLNENINTCVVLRIPKTYLGLAENSNVDISPIFSQVKKETNNKLQEDAFAPMNTLVCGMYSTLLSGYVANPNYSPICNCWGILTDDQRRIAEKIIRESDGPKRKKYLDILEEDDRRRMEFPDTSMLEKPENREKMEECKNFYCRPNSPYVLSEQVFDEVPNRHRMTEEDWDRVIAENRRKNRTLSI